MTLSKIFIFSILWWVTGNPFVALIVLLIILYMLERRFIGLTPSILRPLSRRRRMARLREELRMNPHGNTTKLDIARIYIEQKKYGPAKELLEQVLPVMEDSAEVLCELGICELKLENLKQGEQLIQRALERNPRVKYGEPFLRLGEAYAEENPEKAVRYLEQFREVHSSSCEAYYRQGLIYSRLGRKEEALRAFRETLELYRGLPRYKRRHERKWALLARFK
ncbi:tetratricopeptide repeat protein [Paenibacillus sp. GD4]|uniref:tetratricopeptide repeat protein n=1 Tax=Paenibacillus sp. GD4 TaxID=3068890 RepID=UPI0035900B6D